MADYIAEEKIYSIKQTNKRRSLWQTAIFFMAFFLNQTISFRDHLVIDVAKETPDSIASMAVAIFQGIGYIIIGNLYDNVRIPKKLTFYLLSTLAILTALVSDR